MRHSQNLPLLSKIPEYTTLLNNNRRPSQNLPLPPRIYPLFNNYNIMRPSQNLPLPPKICPLFNQFICATIPESTPPSQNIPPFQQMYMCDPPRIYPSLPEKGGIFWEGGVYAHIHLLQRGGGYSSREG